MQSRIEVNGKTIEIKPSCSRFVVSVGAMRDDIYRSLAKIGVEEKYIDLTLPRNPIKQGEPAQVGWIINGQDFYFQCSVQERYCDNLGVIMKVIKQESYAIRNGLKPFGTTMNQFKLGYDPNAAVTKTPHEILGIPNNIKDLNYVTFRYKHLSKEYHPDTGGDPEKFKEILAAYEQLKKELGE